VTKVLYVEDNDDNVYMLKMRLELLGDFEVLAADNGEKGCEMAAAERPDIILMDLEMPVLGGWEATRRLKGNPQTRDVLSQSSGAFLRSAKTLRRVGSQQLHALWSRGLNELAQGHYHFLAAWLRGYLPPARINPN
jgi:CheY-like chemotaxis protein